MPYVTETARQELAEGRPVETAGELNYLITQLIQDYVIHHKLCYATINNVVGALESAKAEFQRRVVAGYEDKKILENGDVYVPYLIGEVK